MHSNSLTRRDMISIGSGIAITSLNSVDRLIASDMDPLGKDLVFRTIDPRNGEPSLEKLIKSWVTPVKHFYVRSHAPNPKIDPEKFVLSVEGLVRNPINLSLKQLNQLKRRDVTATLTCAGNRRTEFNQERAVGGVQWEAGAIGNAQWSGFALSDVLKKAEVLEEARHVWFEGLDEIARKDAVIPFGGSVPIEKALKDGGTPGALLVDRMNGEPLSPDHGYPLRTVVPGYIGARSVKWLGRIVVSDKPSPNHYLSQAYKLVSSTDPIDWTEAGPIYRYPINGAIATPELKAIVPAGAIDVAGYVLPTGRPETTVRRIELSIDDGVTWQAVRLVGERSEYCWQIWRARVRVTTKTKTVTLRAFDSSGGFMPQRVPWNAKGYLQNSWYRLPISVR